MLKYNCIEGNRFKPTVFWERGQRVSKTRGELYCPFCPSGPYKSKKCFFGKRIEMKPFRRKRSKGVYKSDEFILQVIANLYEELKRRPVPSDFDAKEHGVCYRTIKDRFGGLPQAREIVEREMLDGSRTR